MNEIFHNHALRVMNVITRCVDLIEDPEKEKEYLVMLGQKHILYEAKPEYLHQMGYLFLSTIKPLLEKEVRLLYAQSYSPKGTSQ